MAASPVFSLPNPNSSMRTVADALASYENDFESRRGKLSHTEKIFRTELRYTCKQISKVFRAPIQAIELEEIVDCDLIAILTTAGLERDRSVRLAKMKERLLDRAYTKGNWTCPRYEFRMAWKPIEEAFRGRANGAMKIVRFFEDKDIWPAQLTPPHMLQWQEKALERRSPCTVVAAEIHFRMVLRRAKLQHLVPKFPLKSRRKTAYTLPLEKWTPELREEVLAALAWKRASKAKGRKAKGGLRPASATHLLDTIKAFLYYITRVKKICGITSLNQVLTEELVCRFIDWWRTKRGRVTAGIHMSMSYFHALITTYRKYRHANYRWLRRKLKSLPRESSADRQDRKRNRAQAADTRQCATSWSSNSILSTAPGARSSFASVRRVPEGNWW